MHKPLTFNERMELGRDLAMVRRNRGQATGTHSSWKVKRPSNDRSFRRMALLARRSFANHVADELAQYRIEASGDVYAID